MIVDCHGHYTTAPAALWDWRKQQVADPGNAAEAAGISDDEIRESPRGRAAQAAARARLAT